MNYAKNSDYVIKGLSAFSTEINRIRKLCESAFEHIRSIESDVKVSDSYWGTESGDLWRERFFDDLKQVDLNQRSVEKNLEELAFLTENNNETGSENSDNILPQNILG